MNISMVRMIGMEMLNAIMHACNHTKTWTSMVYPWDVNFGIWYIPFYIQWMYGEYPNYLPLDVLWGISKVCPQLSVIRMIIPIEINNLGLHHLLFFPYISLLFNIWASFYLERSCVYFGNWTRTV
jgi:hypothetical protein